jgi:hypothetical protein
MSVNDRGAWHRTTIMEKNSMVKTLAKIRIYAKPEMTYLSVNKKQADVEFTRKLDQTNGLA